MNTIKSLSIGFCFLAISCVTFAQDMSKLEVWNGEYHLMTAERSVMPGKQGTSLKQLQVVENNGTVMLATSECEKCTPSIFTYQKSESEKLGRPVFFNSMGLYMIAIDDTSFLYCMTRTKLGGGEWTALPFSNFYSKEKSDVEAMTAEKLKEIAVQISKSFL